MNTHTFVKDPENITQFLKTMLWILITASVVSLISDFLQLQLLGTESFSVTDAETNDTRQRIIGMIYFTLYVITAFTFLRWIYTANLNCHGFGAQGLRFTPGWSIGYYFIPILCLFIPYQAMKEIWKASKNPDNWKNQLVAPIVHQWWALFLVSSFAGVQSFRLSTQADSLPKLEWATILSIMVDVIDVGLFLIAIALISNINKMQHELVRGGSYQSEPVRITAVRWLMEFFKSKTWD